MREYQLGKKLSGQWGNAQPTTSSGSTWEKRPLDTPQYRLKAGIKMDSAHEVTMYNDAKES
jgi:hypothetical protein